MKVCMCQISNNLINPDSGTELTLADTYYESLYTSKKEYGYYRPYHYFELPLWQAEFTHALKDDHEVVTHVVEHVEDPLPTADVYLFSVLDVNKAIIADMIEANPFGIYCLGGYIDHEKWLPTLNGNVHWFNTVEETCVFLGSIYKYGTDYSLFEGEYTIPRLTLSKGCLHNCKFCTVPHGITEIAEDDIIQQAKSLKPLKFKLIYLNDKTFGQAKNWHIIRHVRDIVKGFNPDFEGFIVQTSVPTVLKANLSLWKEYGVKVVELGVETVNDNLLKRYRKPQTETMIYNAVDFLVNEGLHVISNIILGLPGETADTYYNTLSFLNFHQSKLFALNIYTLALYNDAELSGEIQGDGEGDSDELSTDRTFWSDDERGLYHKVCDLVYGIGIEIVGR